MGPTIILDKSAFQNLSLKEYDFLGKHYQINLLPILISELVSDISKYPKHKVSSLSRKLSTIDTITNEHFRDLCLLSLMGYEIKLAGRPVVAAKPLITSSGEKGALIDRGNESLRFIRWQRGQFNQSEEKFAEKYRQDLGNIDLNELARKFGKLSKEKFQIRCVEDISRFVESKLNSRNQADLLTIMNWFLDYLNVEQTIRNKIFNRWFEGEYNSIKRFSEYSYFVIKVLKIFMFGLRFEIIGTRGTNYIDLNYLLYLPFCKIFCSSDSQQIDIGKCLLSDNQMFIDGLTLKDDLRRIAKWWENLSAEERSEYAYEYDGYPPELEGSFTLKAWKKYFKPREKNSGNRVSKMTEEEKRKLVDELRPLMEAIDAATKDQSK